MVKKYTPEVYVPTDVTPFRPVEPGDIVKSSGKWENTAFEGDLAAAVMAAQWAANQAKNHKNETRVLKNETEMASRGVKESENKVAANLDAVGNLAREVALKERQTSDTLKWAKAAKVAAENAAKQAIAAARAMGEPQQKQLV